MPRDASGTFTRTNGVFQGSTVWAQQAASGDKIISSSRHDTHDQDEADGLSDSLSRSGKGGMQADLDVVNFKLLNVATGTATSDGVNKAQLDAKIGDVVDDTSPQLGGDLDMNGFALVTLADADLLLTPDGTGRVVVSGVQQPATTGTIGQVQTISAAGVADYEDLPAAPVPAISEWGASPDQTLPSNGALITVAYSAFVPPMTGDLKELNADLVCVTAEHDYTAGQILPLASNFQAPSGNRGFQIYYDDAATTAYARIGDLGVYVFNSSGLPVNITLNRWTLRFKAKR